MSTFNLAEIKEFFLKNEQKMLLFVGFCLISTISFEFGVMQGQKWQQKPLVIEIPTNMPPEGQMPQKEAPVTSSSASAMVIATNGQENNSTGNANTSNRENCLYVGSKSSTKFYLATCSWAKRIKPENVVCFKNAQQAIEKGRTESKCPAAK